MSFHERVCVIHACCCLLLKCSGCTVPGMDEVHAALAHALYALHVCVLHFQSSPAVGSVPPVCLSLHAFCVRSCMCVCFSAARPQFKRGHRKTASYGTILDVPKIVITGTTGPLGFLMTGWSWLGSACRLLCSCVSLHVMPLTENSFLLNFSL